MKTNRGLSPVVASIILVAIALAVSIAVTWWIEPETFGFKTVSDIHTFASLPIPSDFNAYCVVWEWSYHNGAVQFRDNMTALPTNMTIDITSIPIGTELEIKVYYYNITDHWFMFFSYLGERDFVFIVH